MLDSTMALADSSGALETTYTYDPFGNVTVNGADTNPLQFTGRENDATGLYYYRARYYSPTLQRFISQDPIGFAGGDPDLYVYVGNQPISLRDPNGQDLTTGLIGAGLGAVFGGLAAASDPCATSGQIIGGVLGGLAGGFVGGFIDAGVVGGSLAGAGGDLLGQLAAGGPINLGEVGIAGLAGGVGGLAGLFPDAGLPGGSPAVREITSDVTGGFFGLGAGRLSSPGSGSPCGCSQ